MSTVRSGLLVNRDALVGRGSAALRELVLEVVEAGLSAADPAGPVRRSVVRGEDGGLLVDGVEHLLGPGGRVVVLGAGKASARIATALEEVLGDALSGGVVVVPEGCPAAPGRLEFIAGGHPLPTEASRRAARRLMQEAAALGPADVVLACFTGGSSALACLPAAGISFREKRELHDILLRSGAPIRDVNTVRKHTSRIKGGRLAAALSGASIVNLTVSDVVGDHLDAITDPTVPDTTTVADAVSVLQAYDLWGGVAPSVRSHLSNAAAAESPTLDGMPIQNRILVTGSDIAGAMVQRSESLGVPAHVLSTAIEGESSEVGAALAAIALEVHDHDRPFAAPCVLVGAGGETTVTLAPVGEFGGGGPNQVAAIAAALRIGTGRAIAAAFVDTDGMDGSTGQAGALVDGATLERAAELGVDLRTAMRHHRSGDALAEIGDAIVTGPTGRNANDLFAIAVGAGQSLRTP
jgi:glycerate 2-kinase